MRIFKTKLFNKWILDIGLEDKNLKNAVDEILAGLYEANLGGHLYKKRIGVKGKGKRGGIRTLIALKNDERAYFLFGFAKNKKANIDSIEEKIYKKLAALLLSYNDAAINIALKEKELLEVL